MKYAVSAIIHLRRQGRFSPARSGQFVRPDKPPHPDAEGLHLWQGRALTVEEFNTEWAKAVRTQAGGMEALHATLLLTPIEGEQGGAAAEEIAKLKAAHEEQISNVQEGVDEFVAKHNATLAAKDARIAELEALLEAAPETEPKPEPSPEDKPAEALAEAEPASTKPAKASKAKASK